MSKLSKSRYLTAILVFTSALTAGLAFAATNVYAANSLVSRVKGKILLQVEAHGEAWYVNPSDSKKYYLGRPSDAFDVMKRLGIGITDANLSKIPVGLIPDKNIDTDQDGLSDDLEKALGTDLNKSDTDADTYGDKAELEKNYDPNGAGSLKYDYSFTKINEGKIFLQTENKGQAWYVDPATQKRYFLNRPSDAYAIMRSLGLGIANADLEKITTGGTSGSSANTTKNTAGSAGNEAGASSDYSFDADGFLWGTEATGQSSYTASAINDVLKTKYVKYRIFVDNCSKDFKSLSVECSNPRLSDPRQDFNLDEVIEYYSKSGWSMVPMISFSSDEQKTKIQSSEDVDNYVAFVYWFIKNYQAKADIKYVELINSPKIEPAFLLDAQNKAYDKIKKDFPEIMVGTPGFEFEIDPSIGTEMIEEIEYFLDKKNGAKFDFWAFHGYASASFDMQTKAGVNYPPTNKPISNKYANIYGLLEIRKALDANGWNDRLIIDTEHSLLINPGESITSAKDGLASAYAVQELLLKKTLQNDGKPVLSGAIPFKMAPRGQIGEFAWGALYPDGALTKTVKAVGLLWSKLKSYNYVSRVSGDYGKDDVWVEKFKSGSVEMYVFFKPFKYEAGKTIYLDGEKKNYTLILDKKPSKMTLTDIDGNKTDITPAQTVTLEAENAPKYLEINY